MFARFASSKVQIALAKYNFELEKCVSAVPSSAVNRMQPHCNIYFGEYSKVFRDGSLWYFTDGVETPLCHWW